MIVAHSFFIFVALFHLDVIPLPQFVSIGTQESIGTRLGMLVLIPTISPSVELLILSSALMILNRLILSRI